MLIISGCVSAPPQDATQTIKKSPHYESNTPAHGSVLASVPVNIVIDFNFDLGPGSSISIKTGDKEYGTGETIIDSNKLAMRRNIDPNAPDGLYTVNYKACWPDGSCHDGYFQFTIDRTKAGNYTDLRNKTEVTVKLSEIAFKPQNIRISSGTKVIWINEDNVDHYINTDAHPSHTYYPPQNSKALKKGDVFSLTFDKAGIYPYHCSAHATIMTGSIITEEPQKVEEEKRQNATESVIDNPYFPLQPGTIFLYSGLTEDGKVTEEVMVTNDTKQILGNTTIVVRDRVMLDGSLIEETFDWYAVDKEGNVWYFGEEAKEYEMGRLVSTEGSWEAGKDGAKPGIIMKGNPKVGDTYQQEYYKGVAEDMARVLSLNETVSVPYGNFNNCLKTEDWTPLEHFVKEHKYYCPGVGLVLEVMVEGGKERIELTKILYI